MTSKNADGEAGEDTVTEDKAAVQPLEQIQDAVGPPEAGQEDPEVVNGVGAQDLPAGELLDADAEHSEDNVDKNGLTFWPLRRSSSETNQTTSTTAKQGNFHLSFVLV